MLVLQGSLSLAKSITTSSSSLEESIWTSTSYTSGHVHLVPIKHYVLNSHQLILTERSVHIVFLMCVILSLCVVAITRLYHDECVTA